MAVATYSLAFEFPALWSSLKYTFITLGTGCLIVLFDTRWRDVQIPSLSWLSSVGFYSYFTSLIPLFNIHLLLELAERFYPGGIAPFWLVVASALGLTHAQAVVSYRYFEGPVMKYGRSLEPARHGREMGAVE